MRPAVHPVANYELIFALSQNRNAIKLYSLSCRKNCTVMILFYNYAAESLVVIEGAASENV